MNDLQIALNPNPIVNFLGKPAEEFTKQDLIRFIEENGIRMVNLRYVAGDGRLKTLNFVISSKGHLDGLLSLGERVDAQLELVTPLGPGAPAPLRLLCRAAQARQLIRLSSAASKVLRALLFFS